MARSCFGLAPALPVTGRDWFTAAVCTAKASASRSESRPGLQRGVQALVSEAERA